MFMRLMNILQIASLQQIIVKEDLQLLTERTLDLLKSRSFFISHIYAIVQGTTHIIFDLSTSKNDTT